MENKEFFSLFSEFRFEVKIEKPLELISHSNLLYYWFRVGGEATNSTYNM
jgi:hypothetical protein